MMPEWHRCTDLKGYKLEEWFLNVNVHQNNLEKLLRLRLLGPISSILMDLGVGRRIYITNSQVVLMILFWGPHVKDHWTRGQGRKHRLFRCEFHVTVLVLWPWANLPIYLHLSFLTNKKYIIIPANKHHLPPRFLWGLNDLNLWKECINSTELCK